MATKRQKQHSVVVRRDKDQKLERAFFNNLENAGVMRQAKQEIQHVRAHRRWDRLMFVYTDVADKLIYILSGGWHDRLRLKRGDK